jgi:hypothetical protein
MADQVTLSDFDGEIIEYAPVGTLMASFSVDGYDASQLTFSIADQGYWYSKLRIDVEFRETNAFKVEGNKLIIADDRDLGSFSWRFESFDVAVEARDVNGNLVAKSNVDFDPVDTLNDIRGTSKADKIVGSDGIEKIIGGAGDDHLYGKGGNDILYGGTGKDYLYGGGIGESDTFLYKSIKESTVKAPDVISRWDHVPNSDIRDLIDLHYIDANTKVSGNQAFDWLGNKAFTGHAGELRYEFNGVHTFVYADVNGDTKADFAIQMSARDFKMYSDDFLL